MRRRREDRDWPRVALLRAAANALALDGYRVRLGASPGMRSTVAKMLTADELERVERVAAGDVSATTLGPDPTAEDLEAATIEIRRAAGLVPERNVTELRP